MADNSDTEVLAGIFGGLVVAIATVAVVIGTDGPSTAAASTPPARSIEINRDRLAPSPAALQHVDPPELRVAEKPTL